MQFFEPSQELTAMLEALVKQQAVSEFNLDGTITANQNFLGALGISAG